MAFDSENISRGAFQGSAIWRYTTADTTAQVITAGYFSDGWPQLKVDDLIFATTSDGLAMLTVTSVSPMDVDTVDSTPGGGGVIVSSVVGSDNITVDDADQQNPVIILDNSQTFEDFTLNTTDDTGIAQGFSSGGNSVFTWSYDGANTSASINFNSIPYVTATLSGVRLADVNFGAFGGTQVPQPALTTGTPEELISALGTTSGLSWVDDSAVTFDTVIDPVAGADDDNKDVFPPENPQRHNTIKFDTTAGPQTAHMETGTWLPGDTIRPIDSANTFTANPLTIDFETHNFEGNAAPQTLVMSVDAGAVTLEYISVARGFQRIAVV